MYAMAYITRIKKTFLPDARMSSNFIKRMEKLTKTKGKYLSDAKKKVLTLNVSKQWLDMIVAGEKTEEYLEIKPYWIKRLTTNCEVAYDVAEKHIAEMCFIALAPMSSSLTVIARIAHESRRILRV